MGRREGIRREYYETGELESEHRYRDGVFAGVGREYSRDGKTTTERQHAEGILLKQLTRTTKGDLRVTFELTPDHPNYSQLSPELRRLK